MKNVKTLRCVFNWQPNVFLWEICWHIAFLFMLVFFLSVHSIHKSMLGCCFRFIISGNWNGKGSKSWNVNMKNVNVIPPISETPAIASYFSFLEFIIRMKHFHFISFLFFLVDHFFYSTLCFVHIHFSFFLSQNSIWFKIHCKIECESSKKKTHREKSALEHMLNLFINERKEKRKKDFRSTTSSWMLDAFEIFYGIKFLMLHSVQDYLAPKKNWLIYTLCGSVFGHK